MMAVDVKFPPERIKLCMLSLFLETESMELDSGRGSLRAQYTGRCDPRDARGSEHIECQPDLREPVTSAARAAVRRVEEALVCPESVSELKAGRDWLLRIVKHLSGDDPAADSEAAKALADFQKAHKPKHQAPPE